MKKIESVLIVILVCSGLNARPKVALVLSGGGAKGIAEIAVLETMERYGIPIDMVLGTSMGSLVGGLYCAGYSPKEVRETFLNTDMMDVLNFKASSIPKNLSDPFTYDMDNIFSLGFGKDGIGSAPGLIGDQGILNMMGKLLSNVEGLSDFDHLPTPFRCIGTDAVSGQQILYSKGSLITAIRSSISIPVVFSPYPQGDGTYAMDGGLVNNFPLKLARDLGADFVIGVDVGAVSHLGPQDIKSVSSAILQTLVLVVQSNSTIQYPYADVVLFPDVSEYGTMDFFKAKDIYEVGKTICEQQSVQFETLRDAYLKAGGTLITYDPERTGAYKAFSDRIISDVEIQNLSPFEGEEIPKKELFSTFVGKRLDQAQKERLVQILDRLRVFYNLSSVSFDLDRGPEVGQAVLRIRLQGYEQTQNIFYLGGYTTIGYSNNTPGGGNFWLTPSLSLVVDYKQLYSKKLRLRTQLYAGATNFISATAQYDLLRFYRSTLRLDSLLRFQWGSLEPMSNPVNWTRGASMDLGLRMELGFKLDILDTLMVKFGVRMDRDSIHATGRVIEVGNGYLGVIWDNLRDESFSYRGGSLEALGTLGACKGKMQYSVRLAWRQRFELVHEASTLGLNVSFSMMREPYQLSSGYVDYGGFWGMPGYSYATFRRDIVMGGVYYQQKIASIVGMPLLVILQAKIGTSDGYDPYENRGIVPDDAFFSGCIGLDAGFLAALGLDTPIGDFALGFGYSRMNKFSVVLGLI